MWTKSTSDIRPLEVDTELSKEYVYLRRNIESIETENGVVYEYEECTISKDIYPLFESLSNKVTEQAELLSKFAEKEGYVLKEESTNVFTYVKSSETSDNEDGSAFNPYKYNDGMSVEKGYFYYSDDKFNPWECIKTGTPNNFSDKDYFDIVE